MPAIVPTTKNVLIVAGDPSGDVHGSNLIKALKKKDPEINVACLGGRRMQEACDRFIYDLASIGASGFLDPFKKFFLWIRLISLVRKFLEEKRPACVIAIDFYGLNHQILGLARHRKIPCYYYVSPQVWASRPKRAEAIARLVKHVMVIFPFEEKIYKDLGVNCTYVGHPLLDIMPEPAKPKPNSDKKEKIWKIGILPGSRRTEIEKLMPVLWKSFCKIHAQIPNSRAYIFAAKEIEETQLISLLQKASSKIEDMPPYEIIREDDYAIRKTMDIAITTSGTATLENTLLGLPMSVVYKLPWLTYEIAKRIITVKHISLTNIIAGKHIVDEFIQKNATSDNIGNRIISLIRNPERLDAMRQELLKLRNSLGKPGASNVAADIILKEVFNKNV
jgi:lipid-A-disaccharide synthase